MGQRGGAQLTRMGISMAWTSVAAPAQTLPVVCLPLRLNSGLFELQV